MQCLFGFITPYYLSPLTLNRYGVTPSVKMNENIRFTLIERSYQCDGCDGFYRQKWKKTKPYFRYAFNELVPKFYTINWLMI